MRRRKEERKRGREDGRKMKIKYRLLKTISILNHKRNVIFGLDPNIFIICLFYIPKSLYFRLSPFLRCCFPPYIFVRLCVHHTAFCNGLTSWHSCQPCNTSQQHITSLYIHANICLLFFKIIATLTDVRWYQLRFDLPFPDGLDLILLLWCLVEDLVKTG